MSSISGIDTSVVLVMGVCGVGKSTIAQALARRDDCAFVEADAYHSPENIEAMRNAVPLTDAMRWGWLDRVALAALEAQRTQNRSVFIACSCLKKIYRDRLRSALGHIRIIYLGADKALLAPRMLLRKGHFMSPRLLDSQLVELEPPDPGVENAMSIEATLPVDVIVEAAVKALFASGTQQKKLTKEANTETVSRRKTQ